MQALCLRLNVASRQGDSGGYLFATIRQACLSDEELFLDFAEGALYLRGRKAEYSAKLRNILRMGGSILTVSGDESPLLVEIVGEEAQATFETATTTADEVSEELRTAWAAAYGRDHDPSDAWDHAIKSVEAALRPVVAPNNRNATLGAIIGAVSGDGARQWDFILPGKELDNDVSRFEGLLRLMWPNPDRHGGGGGRAPSLEEARAVVGLAATIVQWHREGWVVRRR